MVYRRSKVYLMLSLIFFCACEFVLVATINVVCAKDHITIMVNEHFFRYYNVKMETLHLGNEACRAHREVIFDVSFYVVRTFKDQYAYCGGKSIQNSTHVIYSQILVSGPEINGKILRNPTVRIEYQCVYPYIRTISLPFVITPFSSETVMRMNEMEATIMMRLYKDQTYREAFSSSPLLHLRDKVYVEIRITEPEDFFHLTVQECWATPFPKTSQTGSSHLLLLSGCVKDGTARFLNGSAEGRNRHGSVLRFSFYMFSFIPPSRELYLHCAVQLCIPDDRELCIPECKPISKRDVLKGVSEQGLLSYGPVRLDIPDKTKPSLLLVLVLPVGGIWFLGIFLFIVLAIAKVGRKQMSNIPNS
ncbi:hypothetical protein MATL_G00101610 [Megalops atlanticus]|uniref:ZP domain-containing protein n=1 Tax=Megalops atlanticus TaxID=7932 RepID=A0A9D3Q2Z5_MEGAT|nr:hypothetical protein MATL_G00101610 [Megalops atlanticus]